MKYLSILLFIVLVITSCEHNECCVQPQTELQGRYTHQIPNCDNQDNAEIVCVEWMEFVNESEVDLVYGGNDIVRRFTYIQGTDYLILEGPATSSFKPIFNINGIAELERRDNGDLWIREQ